MKTFNSNFDIYFEDISPSGKVHLEKIAEWMSMTREHYFKATCRDHLKFVDSPVKMFTSSITITVCGVSRWTDRIKVILTTANIKKISFEMHIDFQNDRTKDIIAKGMQKVIFVNTDTEKFARVPDDMMSVIVNYVKPT